MNPAPDALPFAYFAVQGGITQATIRAQVAKITTRRCFLFIFIKRSD
jgi:hypothetical protein